VLSSTLQTEPSLSCPLNGRAVTKVLDFQPGIHGNRRKSPNYETNAPVARQLFLLDGVRTAIIRQPRTLIGAATSTAN